ncbi:hypothetical protein [Rugamonas rubra]|uniref:Uncharacterized protein n=1 Tax=Rugamonas rubra TaxID=758825 RepID=A0A1I4HT71_9BURK|nr:hypothetical protein [Rugamonas rubra]SFL44801.1 hypothetical protein SAMN02982985_00186 [Rugamonas rubra]
MSLIEHVEHLAPATLCLHLGPQQLLALPRRGRRPDPAGAQRLAYARPDGHWQNALDALREYLLGLAQSASADKPAGATARAPLEISLAGRWCQMTLAPWSEALLAEPGAARFLQNQLAAVYGDAARGWSLCADDAPYGQPRLVCGIDAALLQGLRQLAEEQGRRCRVVEPLLGAVWRALAPAKPQAFAVVEAGRMTLAALARGGIAAIQTQPCGAGWHAELAQAWQRWTLRAPELAGIAEILVVDMSGAARPQELLAPQFKLVAGPYGAPSSASGALMEAA